MPLFIGAQNLTQFSENKPSLDFGTKINSLNQFNGTSYKGFDDLSFTFDTILKSSFNNLSIAGLSAAVITKEGTWKAVQGISSFADSLNTQMVFGMGSISKSIAAATILKLEEEGVLTIEDELNKWVGNYNNIDSSITIRQLLNHTSGIYNMTDNTELLSLVNSNSDSIWAPETVLDNYIKEPYFAKGEGFHYSNTNYVLIGMIIESATGKKYHEIARSKVLAPAGLDSIYLKPFEPFEFDMAHLWADVLGNGNSIDVNALGFSLNSLFSVAWAAGGFVSQTEDVALWMKKLAKKEVLSTKSQNELLDGIDRGSNAYYGLGIVYFIDPDDNSIQAIGHNGNIGYTSVAYYFPKFDVSISIQCNDTSIPTNVQEELLLKLLNAYVINIETGVIAVNNENVNIYPNPVNDKLHINIKNENIDFSKVSIFNAMGQKILTWHYNNENIDVSALKSGIYYLRLNDKINIPFIKK